MRFEGLYVCCFLAFATHAVADDKANEIMVSDKACTERKLAACIMEGKWETEIGKNCPEGATEIFRGVVQRGGFNLGIVECKVASPAEIFKKPTFEADRNRCQILVENFPSLYGENCLKARTDERQLSTLSSILSQIEKRLCTNADGSKCDDLNKVPD